MTSPPPADTPPAPARRVAPAPPAAKAAPRYTSAQLFGTAHEVLIDHASQTYRLRRTALGKLILTK